MPRDDKKKINLTEEDWKLLLPGKNITIGKSNIYIEPLGLEDFVWAVNRLDSIREELQKAGVTLDNYSTPAGIAGLAKLIKEHVPDILSYASNVEENDIKKMPLGTVMELLATVIDVNIESQEGLLKNFVALAGRVRVLISSLSGRLPNTSSRQGTDGPISEDTPLEQSESSQE